MSICMLPSYVVLDLETTGGNATLDRIIEIAAVRIDNGVETRRWSTLVNPGVRIPVYIQSLTGITDAMVAEAPSFAEIAKPLLELLGDAVFVAHNARFDHGFILHELLRLEKLLKVKTLCTVRLSRRLYPQHKGHGLDAIMQRHGLQTRARHRAMGDVDVVLQWLQSAQIELGLDVIQREAKALLLGSASLPPHLETTIQDIPDTPGVYLFYGEGTIPLYIGKSKNIRTRVSSHFQSATKVPREMRILQEIRRVEWRETAGELGALLLESRLVKDLKPLHNRQLRKERELSAWRLHEKPDTRPLLQLVGMDEVNIDAMDQLYGTYRSKRQAMEALRVLADAHQLCPQAMGLEPRKKGACFSYQIGKCKGVCVGQESAVMHRIRLQIALAEHRLKAWPYPGRIGIREHHAGSGRTEIHIFDHWCHITTARDDDELADIQRSQSHPLSFDLDTYRLLIKRLATPRDDTRTVFHLPRITL